MEKKQKGGKSTSSPPQPTSSTQAQQQKQTQNARIKPTIKRTSGSVMPRRNVKFAQPISRLKIIERPPQSTQQAQQAHTGPIASRELTKKDLPPVLSLVHGMEMAAKQFNLRPNSVSRTGPETGGISHKPVATTGRTVPPKAPPQPLAANKSVSPAAAAEDEDEAFGPVMSPARSSSYPELKDLKNALQQNPPAANKQPK